MGNEFGQDDLLSNEQRLAVADQVHHPLSIVKQVVIPWVLFYLQLLPSEVHLLSCIDFGEQVSVWLGHVVEQVGRLPFGVEALGYL